MNRPAASNSGTRRRLRHPTGKLQPPPPVTGHAILRDAVGRLPRVRTDLPPSRRFLSIAFAAFASLPFCIPEARVHAAQIVANPDTYRALVPSLRPGDELLLEPGIYRHGLTLHGLHGTADRPIRIRGPVKGAAAVLLARRGSNTISLINTAHVQIAGLVLDGLDLEVDAVKAEGSKQCSHVHHITLEDLFIVRHGADQQIVAISSMCPAWAWVIRRNIIVGAGTGLYLGRPDGTAPFVGGLIEQNVVIDTRGYNLQIKHQLQRPTDGMPVEKRLTVIRHNVFAKAYNASAGPDARPNLLLGHFPLQGPGSEDSYEVADNVFLCSPSESLIQAEGNVKIAGNLLVNSAGHGIVFQPHRDVPRRVTIERNFVAASGRGIAIVKASALHEQTVTQNRVFSPTALEGGTQKSNQTAPFPPSRQALIQWLNDRRRTGRNTFAPLIAAAGRLCSGEAEDRLHAATPASTPLADHPICSVVKLLASSPVTAPESAASIGLDVCIPR